jgi:hypothetical protein
MIRNLLRRSNLVRGSFALALCAATASAQVSVLSHPNQLTPTANLLTFEGVSGPITEQFASQGAHFVLTNGAGAGIFPDPAPRTFGPSGNNAINNLGQGPVGMVITFDDPQNRIAFELRNAENEDLVVTISTLSNGMVVDSRSFLTGLAYTFIAEESVEGFDYVLLEVTGGAGTGSFLMDNLRFETFAACGTAFFSDGFETGDLTGWDQLGPVGVVSSALGTAPSNGRFQAILATEQGQGAVGQPVSPAAIEDFFGFPPGLLATVGTVPFEGAAIRTQTFDVNPGDVLRVRWNFLTREEEATVENNDFAFVSLITGGGWLLVQTLDAVFQPTVTGFGRETGYHTFEMTFASGGTMCLGFGVLNATDGEFDSAILLDCVLADGVPPANHAPVCLADFTQTTGLLQTGPNSFVVTEGDTIQVGFSASDDDGDDLVLSETGLPASATLTPGPGSVTNSSAFHWTPVSADKAGTPLTLEVTFTDEDGAACSSSVTIEDVNLNPVCDAGGDVNGEMIVESTGLGGALVTLQGSATDPDDANLHFHWALSNPGIVLDSTEIATPTGQFPMGITMATLVVTDGRGGFDTSEVNVIVQDTIAPEVGVRTDKAYLDPADGSMVPVQITLEADDACFDPNAVEPILVTVRSNEPDDAPDLGDGATTGDVNGFDGYTAPVNVTAAMMADPLVPGRFTGTILLRSERHIRGTGRTYLVDAQAKDSSGNTSSSSAIVVVVNRRKHGTP